MGHVLLAAPAISRFHLHERLIRELNARGHRVTVLASLPHEFTFWSAQELSTWRLRPCTGDHPLAPIRALAEIDCLLAGRQPAGLFLHQVERRLRAQLPALLRLFEVDPPDLVLFHERRSSFHRLVHFLAVESGCRTLWTGDGCLPHTMQIDDAGLGGDAAAARRTAHDYRGVRPDPALLSAAMASLLAHSVAAPLSRKLIRIPPLAHRLRDAWWCLRNARNPRPAFDCWRDAGALYEDTSHVRPLPDRPFVAVLLQRSDCADMRLHAATAPDMPALLRATVRAAWRLEDGMPVVAIEPNGGLAPAERTAVALVPGVLLQPAAAAATAMLTALAIVTNNHNIGACGLLAGTPLLHLGRAVYGLPGIATRTTTDTLPDDLATALRGDASTLRERFLTWLLVHGHVWCSPEQPDHNGIAGLVLEVESRLRNRAQRQPGLRYRAGPSWPLAAEGSL